MWLEKLYKTKKNSKFFFIVAYAISRKGVLYMAQTVNVNFKLDADVKKSME